MTGTEKTLLAVQIVTTTFVAATFLVYYFQLRAMRSASVAQNILATVNFLQAPEVREARRAVRRTLRGKALNDWHEAEERAATLVCSTYDVAGILIRLGLVPAEPFVDNWGPSIRDCHELLEPFIREMQRPEHSGPRYWNDFDWLYKEVLTAQQRRTA